MIRSYVLATALVLVLPSFAFAQGGDSEGSSTGTVEVLVPSSVPSEPIAPAEPVVGGIETEAGAGGGSSKSVGRLAFTGATSAVAVLVGVALVTAGAGVVVAVRRRRSPRSLAAVLDGNQR